MEQPNWIDPDCVWKAKRSDASWQREFLSRMGLHGSKPHTCPVFRPKGCCCLFVCLFVLFGLFGLFVCLFVCFFFFFCFVCFGLFWSVLLKMMHERFWLKLPQLLLLVDTIKVE